MVFRVNRRSFFSFIAACSIAWILSQVPHTRFFRSIQLYPTVNHLLPSDAAKPLAGLVGGPQVKCCFSKLLFPGSKVKFHSVLCAIWMNQPFNNQLYACHIHYQQGIIHIMYWTKKVPIINLMTGHIVLHSCDSWTHPSYSLTAAFSIWSRCHRCYTFK